MMSTEEFTARLADVLIRLAPGEKVQQHLAALIVEHQVKRQHIYVTAHNHRAREKQIDAECDRFLLALEELADTEHDDTTLAPPVAPVEADLADLPELPMPQKE